jgi:ribosomal protein S18 acetylase RimI-like enzyme
MVQGQASSVVGLKDGRSATLRSLEKKDLAELVRFANILVKERRTNPDLGIISLDRRMTRAKEREFLDRVLLGIKSREVASVAAFVGRRLVGNCEVTKRRPHDVRHSGVLGIAILDGYRGVGLGRAMMRTVMSEARTIGVTLVELQVFATNRAALGLYEKTGFRRVGVVPGKIRRPGRIYDEVLMYADTGGTDKSDKGGGESS